MGNHYLNDDLSMRPINSLEIFSEADARLLFERYNVLMLGELLGMTQGLTEVEMFNDFENGDLILNTLLEQIPEAQLKRYQEQVETPPMGVIIREEVENGEG
jgi:hypothetical protein